LLRRTAEKKNVTRDQIALVRLFVQKSWIVPIPGTAKLYPLEPVSYGRRENRSVSLNCLRSVKSTCIAPNPRSGPDLWES
jgi:hypothetical protein